MFYVIAYLVAIVAANLIVAQVGPDIAPVCAGVFVSFDLVARDGLHDVWHNDNLWRKMAALIAGGSALSWLVNRNAGQIALASFVAFALAGIADALLYHRLRKRPRLQRINGSNLLSAAVDSLAFPVLAFDWPPLWHICAWQFVAKVLGGAFWSLVLRKR